MLSLRTSSSQPPIPHQRSQKPSHIRRHVNLALVPHAIPVLRRCNLRANLLHAPPRSLSSSLNGMREPLRDHIDAFDPSTLWSRCIDAIEDGLVAVAVRQAQDRGSLQEVGWSGEELVVGHVLVLEVLPALVFGSALSFGGCCGGVGFGLFRVGLEPRRCGQLDRARQSGSEAMPRLGTTVRPWGHRKDASAPRTGHSSPYCTNDTTKQYLLPRPLRLSRSVRRTDVQRPGLSE